MTKKLEFSWHRLTGQWKVTEQPFLVMSVFSLTTVSCTKWPLKLFAFFQQSLRISMWNCTQLFVIYIYILAQSSDWITLQTSNVLTFYISDLVVSTQKCSHRNAGRQQHINVTETICQAFAFTSSIRNVHLQLQLARIFFNRFEKHLTPCRLVSVESRPRSPAALPWVQ